MRRSLFGFILAHSKKQQIILLSVVAISWPVQFLLYDLPKSIINRAIGGGDSGSDPYYARIFGLEIPFHGSQIGFLVALCVAFLIVVLVNNAFKFFINVYKGRLAERLLRRLRYDLFTHVLRFPMPHFKRVSQGELISMITGESEQVGAFTSGAIADPALLGGQLIVALGFILIQDWRLAVAALALYPVQIYIVPKLQKKVSALAKRRLREVRRLSDHIGETVAGIAEIHTHDTATLEQARFTDRLSRIYNIRYELFLRKYSIKFLNNFLDKLSPFFFYLIGGILVIQGSLTLGALVAVISAHKDMSAPWKELLNWYQQREDAKVKYDQIVSQFAPDDMLAPDLMARPGQPVPALDGPLEVASLGLVDEDDIRRLSGVTFTAGPGTHWAVVGGGGSGKDELAQLLVRLARPSRGRITVAGKRLDRLPQAVLGSRLAYAGHATSLQAGSLRDNLLYGLKHQPVTPPARPAGVARQYQKDRREARLAGNSPFDYHADWVDLAAAGATDTADLFGRMIAVLDVVDLTEDVYQMGLRGTIDPVARADIAASILQARKAVGEKLRADDYRDLVETFDRDRYNTNASVAENLLFGTPVGEAFATTSLARQPYMLSVLEKTGLRADLLDIGRKIAGTMIEIFADLPPSHEFFERYSFIAAEDLPDYQALLGRLGQDRESGPEGVDPGSLDAEQQAMLLALPFHAIPARHRLGYINPEMQERLLVARSAFAAGLPPELRDSVAFFDADAYSHAASIQDNILFGKLVYGKAQAMAAVGGLVAATLESLGLRSAVLSAGLDYEVGVGGARLSAVQRQKLAMARALLKQPDLLVFNEAASAFDPAAEEAVLRRVLAFRAGQGVIWMLNRPELAAHFDQTMVLKDGRQVETGPWKTLATGHGALAHMLKPAG